MVVEFSMVVEVNMLIEVTRYDKQPRSQSEGPKSWPKGSKGSNLKLAPEGPNILVIF